MTLNGSGRVAGVDKEQKHNILVGQHPVALAIDQRLRRLYIADDFKRSIQVVDRDQPNRKTQPLRFPPNPPKRMDPCTPGALTVSQKPHAVHMTTISDNMIPVLSPE